jgi:hypothetical protein
VKIWFQILLFQHSTCTAYAELEEKFGCALAEKKALIKTYVESAIGGDE